MHLRIVCVMCVVYGSSECPKRHRLHEGGLLQTSAHILST